ncbi:MAG: copper homeostasis protein CutC [Bacteroidetes bacterium]|nr:copper homeostasis protein CutC [Bacteroidota bacterium]
MILEACVNSAISAIEAQKGGAERIELCENMHDGGITPSTGTIVFARKHLRIPIFVMIRPRGADFLYSDEEFGIMEEDVKMAKQLGADGVVAGILKPDGSIDTDRMQKLIELASPMGFTCHRAFDMTTDPLKALDDLIRLGVDRILTSGQSDDALQGAPLIRELILRAGKKITIMPGHGIKEHNLAQIVHATGAEEFHVYLTKQVKSKMKFTRDHVSMGTVESSEYEYTVIDWQRIRNAKAIINGH